MYINFTFNGAGGVMEKRLHWPNLGGKLVLLHILNQILHVLHTFLCVFDIFTDILIKSYWASYSNGFGKKWYTVKSIYLCIK